jgi:hypothetical protein
VTTQTTCPLCSSKNYSQFHKDHLRKYLQCLNCEFVFVPSQYHLSDSEEKKRYDTHNNDPNDPRYRQFLSQLTEPLNEIIFSGSYGLDFGCGPGPTLSLMMQEKGHQMDLYDKFYARNQSVFEKSFDFITITEVLEHLSNPVFELERLASILKPKGILGVMTQILKQDIDFKSWYYKNDPSHIGFYNEKSLTDLASLLGLEVTKFSDRVIFFKKS